MTFQFNVKNAPIYIYASYSKSKRVVYKRSLVNKDCQQIKFIIMELPELFSHLEGTNMPYKIGHKFCSQLSKC